MPVPPVTYMRLVKFMAGTKAIWINPESVGALEEAGVSPAKTKIYTPTQTFTVDMAHADVADALAPDTE